MSEPIRNHVHGRQPSRLSPVRVAVPALRAPRRGLPWSGRPGRPSALTVATWSALLVAVLTLLLLVVGPRLGLYRVNVVLSNSMQPHWQAGDLVVTRPAKPQDLSVGQVITFNPPIDGQPSVTHRIIELTEAGPNPVIRTKGDANDVADGWGAVRLQATRVWVVESSVPKVGWLVASLRTPAIGVFSTVVVPILFLLFLLFRIWRPRPVTAP